VRRGKEVYWMGGGGGTRRSKSSRFGGRKGYLQAQAKKGELKGMTDWLGRVSGVGPPSKGGVEVAATRGREGSSSMRMRSCKEKIKCIGGIESGLKKNEGVAKRRELVWEGEL